MIQTRSYSHLKNEIKYNDLATGLYPVLEALANPVRLQILLFLAECQDCTAGRISSRLPLCKSTVSQHMKKLKEAGLIACKPEGVCQNYRIEEGNMNLARKLLLDFYEHLEELKKMNRQKGNK